MNQEEQILYELKNFTGTTQYYGSSFGLLKLTDGVHYLRERANCYWFIDIIESYQPTMKQTPFQIWGIKKNEDDSAMVYCKEDSHLKPIVQQEIPYTDFPLKEYEMYCIDGIVLLKNEY